LREARRKEMSLERGEERRGVVDREESREQRAESREQSSLERPPLAMTATTASSYDSLSLSQPFAITASA
jgi:hypothetical protein